MDSNKRRATRHQTGTVIERSGTFYIRFYRDGKRVAEPLLDNGQPLRRDNHFKSATCRAVRAVADAFMRPINEATERTRLNDSRLQVTDFWTETYLPWCRENLRASTVAGYVKVWDLYLADHLKGRVLSDYKPADASAMMTTWAKTGRKGKGLGRASIGHIRSLGSGLFAHAVKLGVIDHNPWSESGVLTKLKSNTPTVAYTIDDAKAILTALASRLDAQCIFGLAFFMGLRPSEIAGLQFDDITDGVIRVRRAAVQGIVDDTKTHGSVRDLPLIEPLGAMLAAWRSRAGNPDAGYVFPRANGGPLNVESLCSHTIKPLCKAAGIRFQGLYCARRGHGTIVTRLASLTAARQTLGHSSELVTAQHYALKDQIAGNAGLKLLEATYSKDVGTITVTSEK
jgi:integrase